MHRSAQKLLLMRSNRQLNQARNHIFSRPRRTAGRTKGGFGVKRSPDFWRQWLLVVAAVIGIVFTLIQLSGGFISSELTTLFWFLVGVVMFFGAAFAN